MANDINRVILTGNIGKAPQEKTLESGSSYISFSLAVKESYKKGHDFVNNTHWVYCQCWVPWLKQKILDLGKGARVCLEGSLNVYRPQEGDSIVSIKVSKIIAMKQKQEESEPEEESQKPDESKQEKEVSQPAEEDDTELPF